MDIYHIWADLKDGHDAKTFADDLNAYLGHLRDRGLIERWRLTRRKLGLAPDWACEFHIMVETTDMAQLDAAFQSAASHEGKVEELHSKVYSAVRKVQFALYRDWPD
ncbi:MAG: hypothetical protein CME88_14545 [Hirschia sp.]|nr:hypothetical protein [Hirschia sp.]MBF19593.1 hypothetical protein [Hirschia sp.]